MMMLHAEIKLLKGFAELQKRQRQQGRSETLKYILECILQTSYTN